MAQDGPATATSSSLLSAKRRAGDSAEVVITLAQPRPGTARRTNEYTETPFKAKTPEVPKDGRSTFAVVTAQPKKLPSKSSDSETSSTMSSDSGVGGDGSRRSLQDYDDDEESIICRRCGRCRCDDCRTPRPLPSRWVCHDKFLCSATTAVDYCSCLCCVKGLFYHWGQNYGEAEDEGVSCADQPCSCAPRQRCLRWGCLGLLSFALPCLCCYLPLRGCLGATERLYGRMTSHGCRCPRGNGPKAPAVERTEKRLLQHPDC